VKVHRYYSYYLYNALALLITGEVRTYPDHCLRILLHITSLFESVSSKLSIPCINCFLIHDSTLFLWSKNNLEVKKNKSPDKRSAALLLRHQRRDVLAPFMLVSQGCSRCLRFVFISLGDVVSSFSYRRDAIRWGFALASSIPFY